MSTVEQVVQLKRALRIAKTGESFEQPEIVHTTNRGHKLEHGARYVSSTTLKVPDPYDDGDGSNMEAEEELEAEDLKIDVAKLLQPISDPAEVSSNPAIKQIFMNPFLKQLSREMLDDLVQQKESLAELSKLMEALLGDDDMDLMPQIMAHVNEQPPYIAPEPGQPLPPVKEDIQWFFQRPELKHDNDLGLEKHEAQALREKVQIAQQQLDEYIQCMTRIRMGLTRTHRLRRSVLNWCREMNNEDYVKADLDEQNNFDNAGLGEQPIKDLYQNGNSSASQPTRY